MSRRPSDKRILQAAVAFWHNASSDDEGTMPEEWTIVDGWSPAPGYYTTIVRRTHAAGWRFEDGLQRNFHAHYGGEVAVETKGNRISEVSFYNGRVPQMHGRVEGETYDDHGMMIWHYKNDDDDRGYDCTYSSSYGEGGQAQFQPARENKSWPKPKDYGSWS